MAALAIDDPGEAGSTLWHGVWDPIAEDWRNGNYGSASGRFGTEGLMLVLGPKGLNRLALLGKGRPSTVPAKTTFLDRHGRLANGAYTVDEVGMKPHMTGSFRHGKSQFLRSVDVHTLVLDAARHADANGLWSGNKAKVYVRNGPIGATANTGELTSWVNVYRNKNGFVHGAPGNAP